MYAAYGNPALRWRPRLFGGGSTIATRERAQRRGTRKVASYWCNQIAIRTCNAVELSTADGRLSLIKRALQKGAQTQVGRDAVGLLIPAAALPQVNEHLESNDGQETKNENIKQIHALI